MSDMSDMNLWRPFSLLLAFALGSIPTALWLGRRRGVDLRASGSGNLGATNVYRTLGPRAGLLVLGIDLLKGAGAVLLVGAIAGSGGWAVSGGVSVILGHVLSPWAGFRGGKGVATGGGAVLALAPVAGMVTILVFVITVALTRLVSLGSILAAASLPLLIWATRPAAPGLLWASIAISALVIARHRTNIGRIINGTERRFVARAGTARCGTAAGEEG